MKRHSGQFKKGNPGKSKGTLNTITKTIRERVLDAFNELQDDPVANLVAWGKREPTAFYMIASKIIPTEVNHTLDNKIIKVVIPIQEK